MASRPSVTGSSYATRPCPSCRRALSYPQRFCAACGRWLNDPVFEHETLPLPPPADRPALPCRRCRYPAYPYAAFCANCGEALLATPPPPPPRQKRAPRDWPWLPYVAFPLMLVFQIGLLVVLVVTAHGHLSTVRIIFIGGIAIHGIANVVSGASVVQMLFEERGRQRRARPPN